MDEPRVDDAGIGAAARMGIEMYHHAARGSGRTRRMIQALQPNSIVLCWEKGHWLEQEIRALRGSDFKFTVEPCISMDGIHRAVDYARGHRRPVAMDHFLIAQIYLKQIRSFTQYLADLSIPEHNQSLIDDAPPPARLFRVD